MISRTMYTRIVIMMLSIVVGGSLLISRPAYAQTTEQQRAQLEQELAQLEKEIKQQEQQLEAQKKQTGSIKRDLDIIRTEISQKRLEIEQKTKRINNLSATIHEKNSTITKLTTELEREKQSLAHILRNMHTLGSYSFTEFLWSDESLSAMFSDLDFYEAIQGELQNSFKSLETLKVKTRAEREALEAKKAEEANIKYALEADKAKVEVKEGEKVNLHKISITQEKTYEQVLADRKAKALAIRSELIKFQGSGVNSRSISFGEAYDYAKAAEKKTGVRAAFIMAIMQQETAFGNNVGGCYLQKVPTAAVDGVYPVDGIYIKSGNPSRKNMIPSHYAAFLRITSALGRDWKTTPISCALVRSDGSIYGYGGAMGYTQFIPGTWELVSSRVQSYLGVAVANPWNPRDAVMATGVFLMDKGAANQNYSTEHSAACGYYGACSTYADSVMNKAKNIQITIDQLNDLTKN